MHFDPKEYNPIPTGEYPAIIEGVEPAEGQFGPQVQFVFQLGQVEDVEGNIDQAKKMFGYTSTTLSTKSKLWSWAVAAGVDPSAGLDSDNLIGRRVTLVVTRVKRDDGSEGNKIEGVLPAKKTAAKNGRAQPVAVPAANVAATVPF